MGWETLALPPALFSREGGLEVCGSRRGPHTQKGALLRGPRGLPDCLESWLLVKLKAREGRSSETHPPHTHFYFSINNKSDQGTSLVVQWLRLHASHAGGLGWVPDQGARYHI